MGLALSRQPQGLKNSDYKTSHYGRTDRNHFSARPKPPFDNQSRVRILTTNESEN
ncbi:unnamed protein product [Ectocarpus sp. CCAP 1310/34]|nr:unnamed protein product [Ectocarpus sp. CCAP 1310/34]